MLASQPEQSLNIDTKMFVATATALKIPTVI
jgi:hypothetical protein